MARYHIIHQISGETWEVNAASVEEARQIIGWPNKICKIKQLQPGEFANIEPPKLAKQITPPQPGNSHICPECAITMVENTKRGEFWWQCPTCDLFYHEWENLYYQADQV
jgi:hypothetical protein